MKRLLAILSIALMALAIAMSAAYVKERGNSSRLEANLLSMNDTLAHYRVLDSLNAAQTKALRLKADEYRELYASEHELVGKLQADRRGLMATINMQSQTISRLQASLQPVYVYDTINVVRDTIYCFDYSDKWVDVSGCINDGTLDMSLTSRDELLIVESAQRKRFLGIPLPIRWFGYRSRTVDVLSQNPNTEIIGLNYKTIEQ